jgi:parallel beta-helix repeat protein
MKGLVRVGIAASVVIGLISFGAAPALATHVNCGDTITQDTKLDSDLIDCSGDGIVIGADNITLDFNGHTIDGLSCTDIHPETCSHQDGIDNSGGYDNVRIRNGTITTFENGVLLDGAQQNRLNGLHISPSQASGVGGATGIHFIGSDRNRVSDAVVEYGGDPAILLSDSERNTIEDSNFQGGFVEHAGDGLDLLDGSDNNRVIDDQVRGDGYGFLIESSRGNLLKGNVAGAHYGNKARGAERTVIVENSFDGGFGAGFDLVESNDNRIRNNTVFRGYFDGISISGARNVIESNSVGPVGSTGIQVQGSDNLIRHNATLAEGYAISVSGAGNVIDSNTIGIHSYGIVVGAGSTSTVVEDNLVTRAWDDGIHVDAPGTLIRRNIANDNLDFGIEAVEGVIDGGGNRASGNGNPLQCLNVFCK